MHKDRPGPAALVEPGEPIPVGLSPGRPAPTKGPPAQQGPSCALLSDLRAAAAAGTGLRHIRHH